MIAVEKLRGVSHIITHKDCADGMASAMILSQVLPKARITFIQYSTPEHLALDPEPGMMFCDFSPHRDRVAEFVAAGTLVLDHHKFAKDIVDAFGENGVFADEAEEPGVCGAVLAYRHVFKPLWEALAAGMPPGDRTASIERLATLAGIRDTWQKNDPRWREACEQAEALRFWPPERLIRGDWDDWEQMIQPLGGVLFEKNLKYAYDLTEVSYRFTSNKGTRVIIFSGTGASSDVAEEAGDTADLVVGFTYKCDDRENPIVIFSTRSHTTFNCGAFCKAHGGGGHTKAAGFSVKLDLKDDPNPFEHFREILEVYEGQAP